MDRLPRELKAEEEHYLRAKAQNSGLLRRLDIAKEQLAFGHKQFVDDLQQKHNTLLQLEVCLMALFRPSSPPPASPVTCRVEGALIQFTPRLAKRGSLCDSGLTVPEQ